ncbi:MAG: YqhA family protein [Xanthobacteraceae bacterium]
MAKNRALHFATLLRFIMIAGAVGAAFGAVLMFWEGLVKITSGARIIAEGGEAKTVIAAVMGGTDAFLFGIVLVFFAYAIAFGFVLNLSKEESDSLPSWMRAKGISDLKETLVSIVLVYLVVDFATDWPQADTLENWQVITKAASIFLLAAAFRLLPITTAELNKHHDE